MSVLNSLKMHPKKFLSTSLGSIFLLSTAAQLCAMPPKLPREEGGGGAAAGARRAPDRAALATHPLIVDYIGAWCRQDAEARAVARRSIQEHLKGKKPNKDVWLFYKEKDALTFRTGRESAKAGTNPSKICEALIFCIGRGGPQDPGRYLSGDVGSSLLKTLTSRFIRDESVCLNLGGGFILDCRENRLGDQWDEEVRLDLAAFFLSRVHTPDGYYNHGVVLQDLKRYEEARVAYEQAEVAEGFDNIGGLYEKGLVGKDLPEEARYQKAEEYYRRAGSHTTALENLASLYARGGIHPEWSPGERLQRSKEVYLQSGSPAALTDLGMAIRFYCDAYGEDGQATYAEAQRWLEGAQTPKSFHELGMLYSKRQNFTQASELFTRSNTPSGWNNLGVMYLLGQLGEEKSIENALECWKKAGDGIPEVKYNQAYVYLFKPKARTLFKNDTQRYKKTFEILHALQTGESFHLLGLAYSQGTGIPQDLGKAKDYLQKAIDAGRVEALYDLLDLQEALEEKRQEDAAEGGAGGGEPAAPLEPKKPARKKKHRKPPEAAAVTAEGSAAPGLATSQGSQAASEPDSEESSPETSGAELPSDPLARARLKELRKKEKQIQRAEDVEIIARKRRFHQIVRRQELSQQDQGELFKGVRPVADQQLPLLFLPEAKAQMKTIQDDRGLPYYRNKLRQILTAICQQDISLGRPEVLTGPLAGWLSRRVDHEHRVVYQIVEGKVRIMSVRDHYPRVR